jgi:uncharacterized membrane protein SpoIIM required for sporulation
VNALLKQVAVYWWDAKYIVVCATVWFIVSVGIGSSTAEGELRQLTGNGLSQSNEAWLKPILHPAITYHRSEVWDPHLIRLTLDCFFHNLWVTAGVIYLGSLIIFFPPLSIFAHGWLIGALAHQGGYEALIRRTIPHGVVEIPVLLSAASIATLLAFRFYAGIRSDARGSFFRTAKDASLTLLACIPFDFIAAGLEGYGTRILWG